MVQQHDSGRVAVPSVFCCCLKLVLQVYYYDTAAISIGKNIRLVNFLALPNEILEYTYVQHS